jgi:hypothetical protein
MLGYLIGRKESIERVAADRNSVLYGLAFVIAAGFCREYDQEVLATHWYIYLAPIAASLVMASWNYVWLRFYVPKRFRCYLSFSGFLGLFWMTAPCAWIYALPVERWFDSLTAIKINMSLLVIVAVWRGWIFCRALTHLWGRSMYAMVIASAATIVVPLGMFSQLTTVVGLMGGGQFSPEQRVINDFAGGVIMVTIVVGLVCLITFLCQRADTEHDSWHSPPPPVVRKRQLGPTVVGLAICITLTAFGWPVQQRIAGHEEAKRILLYEEWDDTVLDRVDRIIRDQRTISWRTLQPRVYGSSMRDPTRPYIAFQMLKPRHSDYLHEQVKLWVEHTVDARHAISEKEVAVILTMPEDNPMRLLMEEKFAKNFETYHEARRAEAKEKINTPRRELPVPEGGGTPPASDQ